MDLDYETLLDKAFKELKTKSTSEERFKIPNLESMIQGKKTIIRNFRATFKTLKRDLKQVSKFFVKETGVPATIVDNQLILNGIFNSYKISQIYQRYINQFVLCKQCGKADTKLIIEKGVSMMKCEACGALTPIRKI